MMFASFLIVACVLVASVARAAGAEIDEFEGVITEDLRALRAFGFEIAAYQTPPRCAKAPEAVREEAGEYAEGTMVFAFLTAYSGAVEALQNEKMNRFGLISVRFSLSPKRPDAIRVVRVRVCGWKVKGQKSRNAERYRDIMPDHLVPFFVLYNLAFTIAPPKMTAETLDRCGCETAETALTAIEVDVPSAELRMQFRSRWMKRTPPASTGSKTSSATTRGFSLG